MDYQLLAVVLSIGVWVLYLLVPILPAVIFYKWFPDTKVAATGPLSGLTVKMSGAFAAYVITVFLGYYPMRETHAFIGSMLHPTWTIRAKVQLRDQNNKPISSSAATLQALSIYVNPDMKEVTNDNVVIKLPDSSHNGPTHAIRFVVPKFGEANLDLGDLEPSGNLAAFVDSNDKMLRLKEPVIINYDENYGRPYQGTPNQNTNHILGSTSDGPPLSANPQ
jgi:hypothetical protein